METNDRIQNGNGKERETIYRPVREREWHLFTLPSADKMLGFFSEWVRFNVPPDTVLVISGMAFTGKMHTNT